MRPDLLNPCSEADGLKGVGPNLARPLEKLGLKRIRDFIYHLPDRFVHRRAIADLDEGSVGEQVVVALTPVEYRGGPSPRRPRAGRMPGQPLHAGLFRAQCGMGEKQLPLGESWVAGRLDQFGANLQIVHPDHVTRKGAGQARPRRSIRCPKV
jgi:ATP-dependent DNA helicase RecG